MQEERDLLVKRIFPELRKRCRKRQVEFTEVDLRWGVTEEQAERGEVLPICLREIENSRPYFICMLGDRYGWVPPPEMISSELIEMQPWLAEHKKKSVTELEIIHGVLASQHMNDRAFFYFRDHSYTVKVDSTKQHDFVEKDPGQTEMLDRLKQAIRDSGCRVRENYRDPYEVAEYVLEDLWSIIDGEFPEGSKPDPLDREIEEHEQYAETRRRVYIGRDEYFRKLDHYADDPNLPLVISGESGSGKSALVANWIDRYRNRNPETFIIQHYLGSSPQSADHIMIIKRIMQEIRRRYSLPDELPAGPDELKKVFPHWLAMAAQKGKMILILDGLNQLEDTDNALELYWLPRSFPDAIRVVISTLPGHVLDVLNDRRWPQFSVFPLKEDERRSLVTEYLERFTKTLDDKQLEILIRSPQTGNPLFLRALLDEMRIFGIYEQLNELMTGYLAAEGPTGLYGKILGRLERDYEQTCPGLVRDALSLIWASRRGLSEAELLIMLGADGDPLPRAVWSPLYLAIQESLIMREGLLSFFHDYLRQAVNERYIGDADVEKTRHKEIADYFVNTENDYRKADELPWQLKQTGDWDRLAAVMQVPDLLWETWDRNEYEAKEYWTLVEMNTGLSPAEAFREIVNNPDEYLFVPGSDRGSNLYGLWAVTTLLKDLGHTEDAFRLLNYLADIGDDDVGFNRIIRNELAGILSDWGRRDEAMALYKLNEEDARKEGDKSDINHSLNNQALLLLQQGRFKEANYKFSELEEKNRISGNNLLLLSNLINLSYILSELEKPDEGLARIEEAERIAREMGLNDYVYVVMDHKALILKGIRRAEEALILFQESEQWYRQVGDRKRLAWNLISQAEILHKHNLDKAVPRMKECVQLRREMGNIYELESALSLLLLLIKQLPPEEDFPALYQEYEEICYETGKTDDLIGHLGEHADLMNRLEKHEEALQLLQQQEQLMRDTGRRENLGMNLGNQGLTLSNIGRFEEAMQMHLRSGDVFEEQGNMTGLSISYANQGLIYREWGHHEKALMMHKKEEALCRKIKFTDGLIRSLGYQALALVELKQYKKALKSFREQEKIAGKHKAIIGEIFSDTRKITEKELTKKYNLD
jgi:nephrocystin-3